MHYNTIHGWAERYGEEIAVIRDDMDARATVGWAAEKANRIAEYQHDLDVINEYLDGPDLNHQARIRYIDKKTKILHAIAEEMSELPTRIKIPLPSQSPSPRSS